MADIDDQIASVRSIKWEKTSWTPGDALVDKTGGSSREYTGGYYDPEHFRVDKGGWDHDHCSICWWELCDYEDAEHSMGYKSKDGQWLCEECHGLFISTDGRDS